MKKTVFYFFLPILGLITMSSGVYGLQQAKSLSLNQNKAKQLEILQRAEKFIASLQQKCGLEKYAITLALVDKQERGYVAGIQHTGALKLKISIDWHNFIKLSPEGQEFTLAHELGHVALKHHTSRTIQWTHINNKFTQKLDDLHAARVSEDTLITHYMNSQKEVSKLNHSYEFQADAYAAHLLGSDAALAGLENLLHVFPCTPKAHPYLEYCEDMLRSHPSLHIRIEHVRALKTEKNFVFQSKQDDFDELQQKLIEKLYYTATQEKDLEFASDEETEIFKSLPQEVQNQLWNDCTKKQTKNNSTTEHKA